MKKKDGYQKRSILGMALYDNDIKYDPNENFRIMSLFFDGSDPLTSLSRVRKTTQSHMLSYVKGRGGDYIFCQVDGFPMSGDLKMNEATVALEQMCRAMNLVPYEQELLFVVYFTEDAYEQALELANRVNKPAITCVSMCDDGKYNGELGYLASTLPVKHSKAIGKSGWINSWRGGSRPLYDVTDIWRPVIAPTDEFRERWNKYHIAKFVSELAAKALNNNSSREFVMTTRNMKYELGYRYQTMLIEGFLNCDMTGYEIEEEFFDDALIYVVTERVPLDVHKLGYEEFKTPIIKLPNGDEYNVNTLWAIMETFIEDPSKIIGLNNWLNERSWTTYQTGEEIIDVFLAKVNALLDRANNACLDAILDNVRAGVPVEDLLA